MELGGGGCFQLLSLLCWRTAVLSPGKEVPHAVAPVVCPPKGWQGGEDGTGLGEGAAPGRSSLNRCEPVASITSMFPGQCVRVVLDHLP